MQNAFVNYHQADKEWLLSLHNKLSEAEQEQAYKNLCLRREEYRKAVNEKKEYVIDIKFCPHCRSGNDAVLPDERFSCGTKINNTQDRTESCYQIVERLKNR